MKRCTPSSKLRPHHNSDSGRYSIRAAAIMQEQVLLQRCTPVLCPANKLAAAADGPPCSYGHYTGCMLLSRMALTGDAAALRAHCSASCAEPHSAAAQAMRPTTRSSAPRVGPSGRGSIYRQHAAWTVMHS
jgi:hypothetical protein